MYSNQNVSKRNGRKKNVIIENYKTFPACLFLFQSKMALSNKEKGEKGAQC